MRSDEISQQIIESLGENEERPRQQVEQIVAALGGIEALALLARTERIESSGGMMVPDGSRRRTPGGVFFVLARQKLSAEQRRMIFGPPQVPTHDRDGSPLRDGGTEALTPPPPNMMTPVPSSASSPPSPGEMQLVRLPRKPKPVQPVETPVPPIAAPSAPSPRAQTTGAQSAASVNTAVSRDAAKPLAAPTSAPATGEPGLDAEAILAAVTAQLDSITSEDGPLRSAIETAVRSFAGELDELVRLAVLDAARASFQDDSVRSIPPRPVRRSPAKQELRAPRMPSMESVHAYIAANQGRRATEIAQALNAGVDSVQNVIKTLLAEGRVKKSGFTRGTRYFPALGDEPDRSTS